MKINKIFCVLLTACLLVNGIYMSNITAKAATTGNDDIVYVDGIGFKTALDDNGNFTVQSLSTGADSGYIIVHKDGTANASVRNESKSENYNLKIYEMNSKEIDIDVYQKSKKVKEYNDLNEVEYDKYNAQSMGSFYVYSLSLLIEVLLILAIAVVLVSVTYYSICQVIEKVRAIALDSTNERTYYYRSTVVGPQVVIDFFNPISQTQCTSRLAGGLDIYTYFSSAAAYVCQQVGSAGTCIGPEIDQNKKSGYIYFYHFHVNRTNPSHAFYGIPYTL